MAADDEVFGLAGLGADSNRDVKFRLRGRHVAVSVRLVITRHGNFGARLAAGGVRVKERSRDARRIVGRHEADDFTWAVGHIVEALVVGPVVDGAELIALVDRVAGYWARRRLEVELTETHLYLFQR